MTRKPNHHAYEENCARQMAILIKDLIEIAARRRQGSDNAEEEAWLDYVEDMTHLRARRIAEMYSLRHDMINISLELRYPQYAS